MQIKRLFRHGNTSMPFCEELHDIILFSECRTTSVIMLYILYEKMLSLTMPGTLDQLKTLNRYMLHTRFLDKPIADP
jgi:hypothetical protein